MKNFNNKNKWQKVNSVLSVIVFLLAIYIMSMPFLPELELLFNRNQDNSHGFIYQSKAAEDAGVDDENLKPIPEENRIVIPRINVDSKILEGEDINVLSNGETWRRPHTANPQKGGNTVIVAHRYFGQGKNTFYHLNKLAAGDEVIVFWKGEEHIYKIEKVFETDPENIAIEDNTKEDVLTLYTCSGLSAERRFVVVAKPVS